LCILKVSQTNDFYTFIKCLPETKWLQALLLWALNTIYDLSSGQRSERLFSSSFFWGGGGTVRRRFSFVTLCIAARGASVYFGTRGSPLSVCTQATSDLNDVITRGEARQNKCTCVCSGLYLAASSYFVSGTFRAQSVGFEVTGKYHLFWYDAS
jgi:hypothetical protein